MEQSSRYIAKQKREGAEPHLGEEGIKQMYVLGSCNGLNGICQKDELQS